jgi:hypothetical protein
VQQRIRELSPRKTEIQGGRGSTKETVLAGLHSQTT